MVLGGSIAGLLATRVLADHFSKVTLLERDRFPDQPELRKGIAQGAHLHLLLLGGLRAMERLFPGLRDEMLAQRQ
jgi:flavin-dependent dehydrogenase